MIECEKKQSVAGVKASAHSPAAEFKLFDNVADLLKAVNISLLFALIVRDDLRKKERLTSINGFRFSLRHVARVPLCPHQEGGSLKQENLISFYDLCKIPQVGLQLLDVWDELVDYTRPGLHAHDQLLLCFILTLKDSNKNMSTLYRVSSQMEVLKHVHSRGLDSLFRSSSRSLKI